MKKIKNLRVLLGVAAVGMSVLSINMAIADEVKGYLKVNDTWGYHKLETDTDGCSIYEARTVDGRVVIRAPLYRTSDFIFTMEKDITICR
jgi:hypothetical protein